jgi:hypothetical protein
MTRLRPRAEKAESLFVENLKPFSTASAHPDLASRTHVRNAAESGQNRTDANDPGCVKTRGFI